MDNLNKSKKIFTLFFLSFVLFAAGSVSAMDLPNPLSTNDPRIFIGQIIKGIMGISGSVALLFFVYGGFVYLTAQGERDRIERAKNTLTWATIGLVVIFGSYAFLSYVFKMFVNSGV